MRKTYLRELEGRCESRREAGEKVLDVALALKSGSDRKGKGKAVNWEDFVRYADEKEQGKLSRGDRTWNIYSQSPFVPELWNIFHNELDLDRNGHLDADEWASALRKAGIEVPPSALTEFMTFLTSSSHSHSITFPEFRDFLLLMPRAASTAEIYDYYQVMRQIDHDARGAARTTMEGMCRLLLWIVSSTTNETQIGFRLGQAMLV
jgi:solute carrier family 25 phosphate transporter 23/24/25/41